MNFVAASPMATLSDHFLPSLSSSRVKQLILVFTASLLLTIAAKISIPFYPVPLTLQTLVVLLIGFTLGPRLASLALGLYLLEGALGLPVFAGTPAKGFGIAYMTGPTGGYLAGFVIAAVVCGKLAEIGWDRHVLTTFAAMLIGNLIIYVCGLIWLSNFLGWSEQLLQLGLIPFIAGDLIKILIAVIALPWIWRKITPR